MLTRWRDTRRKCLLITIFMWFTQKKRRLPINILKKQSTKSADSIVTVATSDGLEQIIIMGQGANRISARGLKEEIEETRKQLRQEWHQHRQSSHTYLFDHADAETAKLMEEVRLGKKKL